MSQPEEQLAPNSPEGEEAVLGSILINPDALHEVAPFLQAGDFFIVKNGWVFEAIQAIQERGEEIDNLTVIDELRSRGQLDQIGGSAYITYLINNTPTHIHAETYGHIVERASLRRRLLSAASDIAQTALEEDSDIDTVIEHAETTLFGVTERRRSADLVPIQQAAREHYDQTEWQYAHQGELLGIPTGYKTLDKCLSGLQDGTLTIVAARPGVGKTSFMLNVAMNAGRPRQPNEPPLTIALFSLEMSRKQLMSKLAALSVASGLDTQRIQLGNLDDREWRLYTQATGELARYRIFICDEPNVTVTGIASMCRSLHRRYGLDLVIVDYLQLMISERKSENRTQEVSFISRNLKVLARSLDRPILTASQLNRLSEQAQDKRPKLSHLRESGSLEQDSDVVIGLYKPDMYEHEPSSPDYNRINQIDAIILKNRMGPLGVDTLYWHGDSQRMSNMQRGTVNVQSYGNGNGYHDKDGER